MKGMVTTSFMASKAEPERISMKLRRPLGRRRRLASPWTRGSSSRSFNRAWGRLRPNLSPSLPRGLAIQPPILQPACPREFRPSPWMRRNRFRGGCRPTPSAAETLYSARGCIEKFQRTRCLRRLDLPKASLQDRKICRLHHVHAEFEVSPIRSGHRHLEAFHFSMNILLDIRN